MLVRMWNNGNIPPLLVEVQISAVTLETNMATSWKIGNQSTLIASYNISGHMFQKHFILLQGHLLNYV